MEIIDLSKLFYNLYVQPQFFANKIIKNIGNRVNLVISLGNG